MTHADLTHERVEHYFLFLFVFVFCCGGFHLFAWCSSSSVKSIVNNRGAFLMTSYTPSTYTFTPIYVRIPTYPTAHIKGDDLPQDCEKMRQPPRLWADWRWAPADPFCEAPKIRGADPEKLCNAIIEAGENKNESGKSKIKTITFVGDSIMAQMANSFVSLLGEPILS